VAVAGLESGVDHGGRTGEVDQCAVAGGDRFSQLDGLAQGDAGAAVAAGTVDQFGDEATVQDQPAWCGQDAAVAGDQIDLVGGAGRMDDGDGVVQRLVTLCVQTFR
jgi:hypothetical protein